VILREATEADWPEIANFFLTTPVQAGTSFVLDRRPDFGALPALRGRFRTFLVFQQSRLAGTATALWHHARDGERSVCVGEVTDLRVASWARGGRAVFHLLHAIYDVFVGERVDWILALIGKQNHATIPVVNGRTGLPPLVPLEDFASVHFMAARVPRLFAAGGVVVRSAKASDAPLLAQLFAAEYASQCFAPPDLIAWPDPADRHRAWLAFEPDGTLCGALVTWDGAAIRRIRILRYRTADLPLRAGMRIASLFGLANPLPVPGGVFGMWATRLVTVLRGEGRTLRALLDAALGCAAAAGQSGLQLNLRACDPLFTQLPPYPRSTYWSALYGCHCDGTPMPARYFSERYHADIALV